MGISHPFPAQAHVNRSVYASYKYQLNLPGSVSGSYSRNLNHLWMLGSVVALWDAPYVEWYYPALAPGPCLTGGPPVSGPS